MAQQSLGEDKSFFGSAWDTLTTGISSTKRKSVNDPRSGNLFTNLMQYFDDAGPQKGFWDRFAKRGKGIWSWFSGLFDPIFQPHKIKEHAKGSYLVGPSHEDGGIDLGVLNGVRHEAEGGEYILNKKSVDRLGVRTLDYMNQNGTLPSSKMHRDGDYMGVDLSPWPYGNPHNLICRWEQIGHR